MCLHPIYIKKHNQFVSCGQCYECLAAYSEQWEMRLMHELRSHEKSCFITLTYRDDPVNLVPRDLQLFLKRLRRVISPVKIRFFACGEYGGENNRPHYHLIVFGWCPDDLRPHFFRKTHNVYLSSFVSRIWQHGFITVSMVTPRSCRYCAKYLQKLDTRPHDVRPFVRMSNRPGIGYNVIDKSMLSDGCIYYNGKRMKIPRYYLAVLERNGFNVQLYRIRQKMRIAKMPDIDVPRLVARRDYIMKKFGSVYRVDKFRFDVDYYNNYDSHLLLGLGDGKNFEKI